MAFLLRDDQQQAYDECWDEIPGAVRAKGYAYVVSDIFGFLMTAALTVTDEVTFIYYATQVRAGKVTGTGEDIAHGEKVYATLASNFQLVTANPVGVIGTDFYYCGICKKDATADDDDVLIKFIGESYDHADEA